MSVVTQWPVWAMALSGLGAAALQVVAFGAGKLSASLSAIIVATPIASVLIGMTVFGEEFSIALQQVIVFGVGDDGAFA